MTVPFTDTDLATSEADLDERILAVIEAWHRGRVADDAEIDALFLEVFAYQLQRNAPYRRYVEYLDLDVTAMRDPRAIPAVPASAFKDAQLATFTPDEASLIFRTSGTTMHRRGHHYMQNGTLYDASSLAIFDRLVLAPRGLLGDETRRLRFLSLVPSRAERRDSSLGYMVDRLVRARGDGRDRNLLFGENFDLAEVRAQIRAAHDDGVAVCLFGTALALVNLIEATGDERLALPADSLVIETGGFKGRRRETTRLELYRDIEKTFGVEYPSIIAEFGMTELTSQYYDLASSCAKDPRIKAGPPWLRAIVVDEEGNEVEDGRIGALRHLDLANRSSVVAIDTEDLGVRSGGGFVLLGRERHAELRGCSLDAESLRAMEREV